MLALPAQEVKELFDYCSFLGSLFQVCADLFPQLLQVCEFHLVCY